MAEFSNPTGHWPIRVRASALAGVFALTLSACGGSGAGEPGQTAADAQQALHADGARRVALTAPAQLSDGMDHDMDARRGRVLFVTKSCVICHQVNGVGGAAAPALDIDPAQIGDDGQAINTDPLDFAARIWRGAPAMSALQAVELGYQIELSAQDIADLAAFAASADEQALLTREALPNGLENWFINAPISDEGGWLDYRKRGETIPHGSDFDAP